MVRSVRDAVPGVPVVLAGHTTHANASRLLAEADGAFVGTCLEQDGWGGWIELERAREYVGIARGLEGSRTGGLRMVAVDRVRPELVFEQTDRLARDLAELRRPRRRAQADGWWPWSTSATTRWRRMLPVRGSTREEFSPLLYPLFACHLADHVALLLGRAVPDGQIVMAAAPAMATSVGTIAASGLPLRANYPLCLIKGALCRLLVWRPRRAPGGFA